MRQIDAIEKYKDSLQDKVLDCLSANLSQNNIAVFVFNDVFESITDDENYPFEDSQENRNWLENMLQRGIEDFFSKMIQNPLDFKELIENEGFTGYQVKRLTYKGWTGASLMFVYEIEKIEEVEL